MLISFFHCTKDTHHQLYAFCICYSPLPHQVDLLVIMALHAMFREPLFMAPKCESSDVTFITLFCYGFWILFLVTIYLLPCLIYKLNFFIAIYACIYVCVCIIG